MSPKFELDGFGHQPEQALVSELIRHPTETEGVLGSEYQSIVQGEHTTLTTVERIGRAAVFIDTHNNIQHRADQFLKVTVNGYGYGIRQTSPDPTEASGLNIVHFPGFGEVIESGSAYSLHTSLATMFPEARVVSVASDGVGTVGEKLTLPNAIHHDIRGMGEGRVQLLKALFGSQPILVTACSMGSAISQEMLDYDIRTGQNLHVYPVYYDTAVVEPAKTIYLMGVAFPLHVLLDVPIELLRIMKRGDTPHIKELAKMAEQRGGDALPSIVQAASLLGGVAVQVTAKVSKVFKGMTISGVGDPLRRTPMWAHVKKEYCPELHIVGVKWRGHGMAANGPAAGVKIHREVQDYGVVNELLAAA